MSKSSTIEFLNQRLGFAESEQKKARAAQAVAAKLPQWDAEVQALKFLIARLGASDHVSTSSQSVQHVSPISPVDAVPSVAKLTIRALTEAGKPQTTAQLLGFLATHGKRTTSATLRSAIWQSAKQGKLFKVIHPGVYGLIEWEDRG